MAQICCFHEEITGTKVMAQKIYQMRVLVKTVSVTQKLSIKKTAKTKVVSFCGQITRRDVITPKNCIQ
jgi:hypothetical protein